MSEFTMDRLRENLEALKMKNTLEILDNYLERAVADKLNIVEVWITFSQKKPNPSGNGPMRSRSRCPASPSRRPWMTSISLSSPP